MWCIREGRMRCGGRVGRGMGMMGCWWREGGVGGRVGCGGWGVRGNLCSERARVCGSLDMRPLSTAAEEGSS